jgi:hypothetical protein
LEHVDGWGVVASWYLLTTEDRMIPPPGQREMSGRADATVVEADSSHSLYVSQPEAVVALIERAPSEVKAPA